MYKRQDLFSLGAPGSPFEEQRPGVPPRDTVAEFRVMDTAALYFDFYEGGLAFEERDDARLFHFSYQRYLENQIRETFGFKGTPLRFIIRERKEKDQ